MSHCDDWALAAVSRAPIGVDIEQPRTLSPALVRFIANSEEYRWVESTTPTELATLRLWTIKEAVLKARGTGLRTSPKALRVVEASARTALIDIIGERHEPGRRWRVDSELLNGRILGIAYVPSHTRSSYVVWFDEPDVSAALDTA